MNNDDESIWNEMLSKMPHLNDMDIQRKRFLFSWVTLIAVIVFPILMIANYLEGDSLEIKIDLFSLATIIAGFIILKKSHADTRVYRMNLFLIGIALYFSIAIGVGEERILYWTFAIPLLFFFFLGKWEGLLWTVVFIAGLALLLFMPALFDAYVYRTGTIYRFSTTFIIIVIVAWGLESSRDRVSRLLAQNNRSLQLEKEHLEQALKEVKTLSGLIPICSLCKNIRNDEGYWEQVEIYIHNHSEAVFSHGLCPDCLKQKYPEIHLALQHKKKDMLLD